MICHEFKGGIGTASRRLEDGQGGWTVGALVQANHGQRRELRVDGYPNLPPADYARKGLEQCTELRMLNNDHISALFMAAAEAVEEAIVNALLAGRTMQGKGGVVVPALDGDTLLTALHEAGWKPRD
ncbi:hypothetical protein WR25_14124 [Diploscapter pachys]|uniref:Uncharacterized protein n=1 Tax=Diploscapter pachys TaxID=2018661 RepID=A0A2A2KFS0_9BILA|nr:hypothetical protein WR25_14124 [Diploscapter pachys]